jgi:GDPmannose 4,6-dehydratase
MEVRVAPGAYSRAGHAPTIPIIAVNPRYCRPVEVETLLGDATRARETLGWTPRITFDELVAEMVREDLEIAKRDNLVRNSGYTVMSHHE